MCFVIRATQNGEVWRFTLAVTVDNKATVTQFVWVPVRNAL